MYSLRSFAMLAALTSTCLTLSCLTSGASAADVIDWAQWTVTQTVPFGTATGATTSNGTMTAMVTGQTNSVVLPQASTFGISQFSTVAAPQTFYGLLESPNQAGASRSIFNLSGLTASTDKLVYGVTDLKYDTTGVFDGAVTLTLTAFDLANNPVSLTGLQIREQNENDPLVSSSLNGQDLTMSFSGNAAVLEVNPYDNTRNYSHSRMVLLDNFPTGINRIEVLHVNPDTAFIDGIHMGLGVIVPEPSTVALGLTGALGLLIVARKRYNRQA